MGSLSPADAEGPHEAKAHCRADAGPDHRREA